MSTETLFGQLSRIRYAALLSGALMLSRADAGVAIIGNQNLPKLDDKTVQKFYTGKLIEINDVSMVV